jgi:recombinational DNA repair protein (RecF pathway)
MTDYNTQVRQYFNLHTEGKICKKCWKKFVDNYKIDHLLEMNAKAQMNLGTDATKQDQQLALDTAKYVKEKIMEIDKKKAESMFPEIELK